MHNLCYIGVSFLQIYVDGDAPRMRESEVELGAETWCLREIRIWAKMTKSDRRRISPALYGKGVGSQRADMECSGPTSTCGGAVQSFPPW